MTNTKMLQSFWQIIFLYVKYLTNQRAREIKNIKIEKIMITKLNIFSNRHFYNKSCVENFRRIVFVQNEISVCTHIHILYKVFILNITGDKRISLVDKGKNYCIDKEKSQHDELQRANVLSVPWILLSPLAIAVCQRGRTFSYWLIVLEETLIFLGAHPGDRAEAGPGESDLVEMWGHQAQAVATRSHNELLGSEMLVFSTQCQWHVHPSSPTLPAVLGPGRKELSHPHHPFAPDAPRFPRRSVPPGFSILPVCTGHLNIISVRCGNWYFDRFY